jgi:hypothetical protein
MSETLTKQDQANLISLNQKIGDAELQRHEDFLNEILADDLQFRRASGVVVGKAEYCKGVMNLDNEYEYSKSDAFQVFSVGDAMVVSLLVWAKGVRDKNTSAPKAFSGVYRNIRIFNRDAASVHGWLCHFWFNDQAVV